MTKEILSNYYITTV